MSGSSGFSFRAGYVYQLWPDAGWVPTDKVLGWARDAFFNEADSYVCRDCGADSLAETDCPHDDVLPLHSDGTTEPDTLADALDFLEARGVATFRAITSEAQGDYSGGQR